MLHKRCILLRQFLTDPSAAHPPSTRSKDTIERAASIQGADGFSGMGIKLQDHPIRACYSPAPPASC